MHKKLWWVLSDISIYNLQNELNRMAEDEYEIFKITYSETLGIKNYTIIAYKVG